MRGTLARWRRIVSPALPLWHAASVDEDHAPGRRVELRPVHDAAERVGDVLIGRTHVSFESGAGLHVAAGDLRSAPSQSGPDRGSHDRAAELRRCAGTPSTGRRECRVRKPDGRFALPVTRSRIWCRVSSWARETRAPVAHPTEFSASPIYNRDTDALLCEPRQPGLASSPAVPHPGHRYGRTGRPGRPHFIANKCRRSRCLCQS